MEDNVIKSGPFAGRKIESAPIDEIELYGEFAESFMEKIFGIDSFFITDESSLWDFGWQRETITASIFEQYGVDVSDIKNGNLVAVFKRINNGTADGQQ